MASTLISVDPAGTKFLLSQAPHRRSRSGTLLLTSLLGLLLVSSVFVVLVVQAGQAPATSGVGGPALLAGGSTPSSSAADASTQALSLAEASLAAGHGPAHGVPAHCHASQGQGSSLACDLTGSISSTAQPLTSYPPAPNWQLMGGPSGRYGASMVYDAADHYVLLFGGGVATSPTSDTWAFSHGVWRDVTPAYSPPARISPFMAYDPADGYVVLFGGWSPSVHGYDLGDTWTYVGGVWTELHPSLSPSPRDSGAMTWDGTDGYLVLFGDYSGDNDTWTFVHGSWTQQIAPSQCTGPGGAAPCPPGVQDEALAYDPVDGYVVMFGGAFFNWGNYQTYLLNYTWTYAGGVWTNRTANPCTASTCPATRELASMDWDAAGGDMVLFGGVNATSIQQDTWTFVGGTWTQVLAPSACGGGLCPSARYGAPMVFDGADGYLVLWGGNDSLTQKSLLSDTWRFQAGAWWLLTQSVAPPSRMEASMAYDAADGYVVLFGGNAGHLLHDTWTFVASTGRWTNITATSGTPPSARDLSSMAYDAHDGYLVLFGGQAATGAVQDTWRFSGGTWTPFNIACSGSTCPSARTGAALAYDPTAQELVLFGGKTGGGTLLQDTWTFASGAWAQVAITCTLTTCPTARSLSSFSYDPVDGYLVLFGGLSTVALNDTWKFNSVAGTWTELIAPAQCTGTSPCPPARYGASMNYDPQSSQVVLFGGAVSSSFWGDTWTFVAGAWTNQTPLLSTAPPARSLAAMEYDASFGGLLLFGGLDREYLGDTWGFVSPVLAQTPSATPPAIDSGQSVIFTDTAVGGGLSGVYSYLWQGLPPGCTSVGNAATVTCAPTMNGTYLVSTVVTDSNGAPPATSPQLTFVVSPAPTVTVSAARGSVDLGQFSNLTAAMVGGTAPASFLWGGLPPSCAAAATSAATVVCQPLTSSDVGVWSVSVQAYDAAGVTSLPATLTLQVLSDPAVAPPTESRSSLDIGQSVTLSTSASGGAGGYVYNWTGLPAGCGGTSAVLLCTPLPSATGSFTPAVVVRDASGALTGTATSATPFTVYADPTASAPVVTVGSQTVSTVVLGTSIAVASAVTAGSGGDTLVWSGLPTGCTAAVGASSFSCTPTAAGTYLLSLSETDSNGITAASTSTALTVVVPATIPVGLVASPSTVTLGGSVSFNATVPSGSGPYSFAWSSLPAGCLGSNTADLTCTPSSVGSFAVVLKVTGANGASGLAEAALTVVPLVPPPLSVVLSASPATLDVGSATELNASVSGGTGTLTYAWTGLPTSCSATNAARLTCSPSSSGSYQVGLEVSDAAGATGNAQVTLTVDPALVATPLLASSSSVAVGSSLELSVSVRGGSGVYTYAWSGLPSGCTGGNAATITCYPTATGTYAVSVAVSDSNGAQATPLTTSIVVTAAPTGFALGANGLDWTLFVLVILVLVLALVSLLLSLRQRKRVEKAPVRAAPEGVAPWDEGASSSPSSPSPKSTSSPPPTPPPAMVEAAPAQAPPPPSADEEALRASTAPSPQPTPVEEQAPSLGSSAPVDTRSPVPPPNRAAWGNRPNVSRRPPRETRESGSP